MARPSDPAQLLDVEVGQLAGSRPLVAHHGLKRRQPPEAREAQAALGHHHRRDREAQASGLVFATATGGPLDLKNLAARHFRPKAELPRIKVYDLRHTHVTHLLYAHVPVQSVSKRVGHANPTITVKVYAHVLGEIDHDPLKLLDDYIAAGQE